MIHANQAALLAETTIFPSSEKLVSSTLEYIETTVRFQAQVESYVSCVSVYHLSPPERREVKDKLVELGYEVLSTNLGEEFVIRSA